MTTAIERQMKECAFGEARFIMGDAPRPQIALLVRERSAMIRYLGETSIELRPGMFREEDCLVVVVLLRAGRHVRRIYPVWWDYCSSGGQAVFQLMGRQEILGIYFHGDDARRERSFVLENSLAGFFRNVIQYAIQMAPWSSNRFNHARQDLLARAGGLEGFWEDLGDYFGSMKDNA